MPTLSLLHKRIPILAGGFILWAARAEAQIAEAVTNAGATMKSEWVSIKIICNTSIAIVAVVAAMNVYSKWSTGDPDARRSASLWIGSLLLATIGLTLIKALFGAA